MQEALQELQRVVEDGGDSAAVLREALEQMMRLTGATAASLVVHRRQAGELEFTLAAGAQAPHSPEQGRFPPDRGVIGDVIRSGRSALVNDPAADARFFDIVDRLSGFATRNLLAVPLIHQGHRVAAISALNKPGDFTEDDRDAALALVGALEPLLRQVADVDRTFAG